MKEVTSKKKWNVVKMLPSKIKYTKIVLNITTVDDSRVSTYNWAGLEDQSTFPKPEGFMSGE